MKFIIKPKPDLCEGCRYGGRVTLNHGAAKFCRGPIPDAMIQQPVTECSIYSHVSTQKRSEEFDEEAWYLFNVHGAPVFAAPHERQKFQALSNEMAKMTFTTAPVRIQ